MVFVRKLFFSFLSLGFIQGALAQGLYSDLYFKSLDLLLNNLNHKSIARGAVIASPSQKDPNYFYHWTRDAALTHKSLFHVFEKTQDEKLKAKLKKHFMEWVEFENKAQQNSLNAFGSLGEPIFTVWGDIPDKEWGRPQNDGPAARALALSLWAHHLLDHGDEAFVREHLYKSNLQSRSLVKYDLEYVSHKWRQHCFDLWEEVLGLHFYTLSLQRKALLLGSSLAAKLDDPIAANWYALQAAEILKELNNFIDRNAQYIRVTTEQSGGWDHKHSGIDIAVLLAANHALIDDEFLKKNKKWFYLTAQKLESTFKDIYPINHNTSLATAIGRYPEDVYDGNGFGGGNPWFLATHAMAEFYCHSADSLARIDRKKSKQDFLHKGKSYFERTLKHRNQDTGELAEQYSRFSGFNMGASHLTWSYASYLTAYLACQSIEE